MHQHPAPSTSHHAPESPIVIVGAGVTGLAAAFELTRRRVPFLLLERDSRAGGLIRTDRDGRFVIEGGPDALLVQKPAVLELCRELAIADRLVAVQPPRHAFVRRGGRFHPLPRPAVLGIPTSAEALSSTSLFSPDARERAALDLTAPSGHTDGADESIAALVRRRLGDAFVTAIAQPLLAGIHMGDAERLSARALFPRLVDAERRHGSLMRGLAAEARAPEPDGDDQGPFRSLRGGLAELTDALVAALPPDALRLGAGVTRVASEARGFAVEATGGARIRTSRVILALPAYVVAALVDGLDQELARRCREIAYAGSVAVVAAWRREDIHAPLAGSGYVMARDEPDVRITAVTGSSSKWPGRAPAGTVLLRTYLGGTLDPEVMELPDDRLLAIALTDLGRLHGIGTAPLLARVYRWPRANPQYEVGHLARVAAIDATLTRWPGLFVAGAGFRGTGIPDGIASGRAAARAAAAIPDDGAPGGRP